MQPCQWQPPVTLSEQEEQIVQRIRRAKLFVFLRHHRHELFDESFQQQLAQPCLEIARQVKEQNVQVDEAGKVSLIKGVAKDRRISAEDGQMRHGRKSRSVRVDGYKRHVLHVLARSQLLSTELQDAV